MQIYDNSPPNGDYIREIERLEALQRLAHQADVQRDLDRANNLISTRKDNVKHSNTANNTQGQNRKEKPKNPTSSLTAAASMSSPRQFTGSITKAQLEKMSLTQALKSLKSSAPQDSPPDLSVLLKFPLIWIVGVLVLSTVLSTLTPIPFFASLIFFSFAAVKAYRYLK